MIKVFIIDDSLLIRNLIKNTLSHHQNIEVIGEANNPIDAMSELKEIGVPDVFILDLEMPRMDGLTFLKKLKEELPIPTIIFSSRANENSLDAMELGACDVILKPLNIKNNKDFIDELIEKVHAAANSKALLDIKVEKETIKSDEKVNSNKIIVMGSSTGGVQTLQKIITNLNRNHPPILITQHMPEGFTNSFAKRLDSKCYNSKVKEAVDKEYIQSGNIYIAPGNLHLEIEKVSNRYRTLLKDYPKVSGHKPSVDVLFKSLSKEVGENTVSFLLTGMGKDGALGSMWIKQAKGLAYAQDEKSSIVYGMPRAAYEMGAIHEQVSIERIINIINGLR